MIVITTPTGQIGSQVLGNLLDSSEELRAIVRDPAELPAGVSKGLDIVEGSHGDAAVVNKAFSGADAVFWLAPPDPRATSVEAAFVGFTQPAAEAFKRHGVGRVVAISALGRGTPWADRAGYVTGSLAMDDLIAPAESHSGRCAIPRSWTTRSARPRRSGTRACSSRRSRAAASYRR